MESLSKDFFPNFSLLSRPQEDAMEIDITEDSEEAFQSLLVFFSRLHQESNQEEEMKNKLYDVNN